MRKLAAFVLPIGEFAGTAVRMVGFAVAGGVLGLCLGLLLPSLHPIPQLVGLVLGLYCGARFGEGSQESDSRSTAACFASVVLLLGLCFLVGFLFASRSIVLALMLLALAMGWSIGSSERKLSLGLLRSLSLAFLLGATLLLFSPVINWVAPTGAHDVWVALAVASAGWSGGEPMSSWVAVCACLALVGSFGKVVRLTTVGRTALADEGHPAKRTPTREPFEAELEILRGTADRIIELAADLADRAPEETGFASQVQDSLTATLDQAQDAIARWRVIHRHDLSRRDLVVGQIESNEQKLLSTSSAPLQEALASALDRQRRILTEVGRMEEAEQVFGMRLEELLSSLELLELSLERAIAAGGAMDSTDLDAIVDVMGDVSATLDPIPVSLSAAT